MSPRSRAALRSRPPSSTTSALLGSTIAGKYRLVRELGHGGMGAVFKAENLAIGKVVALKLLHKNLTEDPIAMQRFEREARATVAIAHPNIVDVIDMGKDPSGAPFLVMEYVRGLSLKGVLRQEGPLPVERIARIAGQVLAALSAAHRRGIIHRDLKPENILLTTRAGSPDFVKVVDFGISTFADFATQHERELDLTPTGLTMATPFYASPEQIRGANGRDPRVDIYAVGVLIYEMLTARRPFDGTSLPDLCNAILCGAYAPVTGFRSDVPEPLIAVLQRALANKAQDRYQHASELAHALVPFGAAPLAHEEPEPTDTFTYEMRSLDAKAEQQLAQAVLQDASAPVHERLARALCGYFAERHGPVEARQLLESLDRDTRRALTPNACAAAALGRALQALDARFGRGDRAEIAAAGRYFMMQAQRDGQLVDAATPELFFTAAADVWQRWFGLGRARVTVVGRGYGGFEIHAQPGSGRTPLALAVAMLGVLDQGLRNSGGRAVSVRLTKASALGDGFDGYEATWSG